MLHFEARGRSLSLPGLVQISAGKGIFQTLALAPSLRHINVLTYAACTDMSPTGEAHLGRIITFRIASNLRSFILDPCSRSATRVSHQAD